MDKEKTLRKLKQEIEEVREKFGVEFAEVKHGRWVDNMVRDWHCSECGKKVPRQVYFDGYCYNDKLNYCPNCGADMRRVNNG